MSEKCNCVIGLEDPECRDLYPNEYYISDYLRSHFKSPTWLTRTFDYCPDCGQKIALPKSVLLYPYGHTCDVIESNGRFVCARWHSVSRDDARYIDAVCEVVCSDMDRIIGLMWDQENVRIMREPDGGLIAFEWSGIADEKTLMLRILDDDGDPA